MKLLHVSLLLCCGLLLSSARPQGAKVTDWRAGSAKRTLVSSAVNQLQWTVLLRCPLSDDDVLRVKNAVIASSTLYTELNAVGMVEAVPEAVPCTLSLSSQTSRRTYFILGCTQTHEEVGDRLAALLANPATGILPARCYDPSDTGAPSKILVARDEVIKVKNGPGLAPAPPVTASTTQSVTQVWHLDRIDQRSLALNQQYTYVRMGTGVTIYFTDTGAHCTHTDFGTRCHNIANYVGDGINNDDCNSHGTHTMSIAGGTTYGIAKNATLNEYKVLGCDGSGTFSAVSLALLDVQQRMTDEAHSAVVSMSISGGFYQPVNDLVNELVRDYQVAVAVAAGNSADDPALYTPASAQQALTVGASTITDQKASYSNDGALLDLFAPGSSVRAASNLDNTGTAVKSGTSMATPCVAGVVALMLEQQLIDDTGLTYGNGSLAQIQVLAMATPNKIAGKKLLFSSVGQAPVPPPPPTPPPPPPPQPNISPPRGGHGSTTNDVDAQRALAHLLGSPLVIFLFLCVL